MIPTEQQLQKRNKELISIVESTEILLNSNDFGSALEIALSRIGVAFEINHLLLFGYRKKQVYPSAEFNFFAHSDFEKLSVQHHPINEFVEDVNLERHMDQLSKGNTVKDVAGNLLTTMRNATHPLYQMQATVIPVFATNLFWGALILVQDDILSALDEQSEKNLKNFALILGGALHQQKQSEVLADALKKATDANLAKSDFLATMSHKIRTPMNGVIGIADLLAQTSLSPAQQQYIHMMEGCNETLMSVLNDFLDLSKIESGQMEIEENSFDLRLMVENVIDLYAHRIYAKKLGIHYFLDPTIRTNILGDEARVKQILINLVDNAIKFTTEGEIVITVDAVANSGKRMDICIHVKDTGSGMSDGQLAELTTNLNYYGPLTSGPHGNSAFGLVISARLAHMMQGEISTESKQGEGSTFHFSFHAIPAGTAGSNHDLLFQHASLCGKNVLIVLPENSSALFLSSQFKHWGLNPVCISDTNEAIKKLISSSIDLLVISKSKMDASQPDIMAALQANTTANLTPVIMITPMGYFHHTRDNTRQMIHTLSSPVKFSDLSDVIIRVFKIPASAENLLSDSKNITDKNLANIYPMRILVADDNMVNQRIMQKVFKVIGYAVDLASDGIEVLECIEKTKYDLILMDIQMPLMDGYETTSAIRAQKSKPQPLIIAMTASVMKGNKQTCLDCGMDDYISKPVVINEIRSIISKWGQYNSFDAKRN